MRYFISFGGEMKLIFIFIAILNLSAISWAKDFKRLYADRALNEYTQVKNEAVQLSQAVDLFLTNPSETNLDYLKTIWTEARKIYSQTEIYRFYGGPIDGLDGPEG